MFELGLIALAVSFPVFYFYGIYQFLQKNKQESSAREKIFLELQLAKDGAKTEKEKQAFQLVLDFLLNKQPALQFRSTPNIKEVETVQKEIPAESREVITPSAPAETRNSVASTQSPFHSLENINILLYLGAFLMIVACGIFATYSYASWTGAMKTAAVCLFALVFYASGLVMYVRSKSIRPAAVVFTGIGLLAFPLVGVVAYNFWFLDSLKLIWFFTSLSCIALYLIAYKVIRHQLLEYLTLFTALSLFQSSIGMFDLPVHFYYWGFSIFALVLILIDKSKQQLVTSQTLKMSAHLILPLSLLFSLVDISTKLSYFQGGVTCILASIFYLLLASSLKQQERLMSLMFGALLIPCSAVLLWMSTLSTVFRPEIGITLIVIGLIYAQVSEYFSWKKQTEEQHLFGTLSSIATLIACGLTWQFHVLNLAMLLISMCITVYFMYRTKLQILFILFCMPLLFAPYEVTRLLPQYKQDVFVSALYLVTLFGFLITRKITLSLQEGQHLQFLGCISSLGFAFFFVSFSTLPTSLLMIGLIAMILYLVIHLEKVTDLTFAPFCFIYFILMRTGEIYHFDTLDLGMEYLISSLVIYGLSFVYTDKRSDQLVLLSLVGPLLAFSTFDSVRNNVMPSFAIITEGGLITSEGYKRKQSMLIKGGAGAILAGVQVYFYQVLGIEETQLYALSWSAYFVALSVRAKTSEQDLYILLALLFATGPLGMEALDNQWRGLALIGEGIILVLLGMQLKKKIIWQWGVAVLVLEVLYYMRDFLVNLPSWAIFGGLGLALLGGSVFLLQKRKQE